MIWQIWKRTFSGRNSISIVLENRFVYMLYEKYEIEDQFKDYFCQTSFVFQEIS